MDRRAHPPTRRALVLTTLGDFWAAGIFGTRKRRQPRTVEAGGGKVGGATWAGAGRYSAGTVREWPHDLRRLRAPAARHRSDRDQRVARLARRRGRHARQDASPVPAVEAARPGQREPGQLPGHGEHAVRQHHPPRAGAVVPRRRAHRAPDPGLRPLERGDDGRQGEQARRRHRRPPVDVRQLGVAVRDRLQPLLPRQGRRHGRRPRLLPGPRRARHLRPGVSSRGASPTTTSTTSARRSAAAAAACRATRTRG